jgi:predicted acylesterase/phospholipase RssA
MPRAEQPEATHTPCGAPPQGYRGPSRSLILAGGGMRVAYQAGVVRALLEDSLCFSHADGTSGGTINLAMLLSGLSPAEMCERWRTLNVKDFVSLMPLESYLKSDGVEAMGDADGIVRRVFPHLGIDVNRIRAARGMEGTFNVCNFSRKTNEVIPHDRIELDLLVAGISLPIYMPPVRRGEDLYLDSVWIKDANLIEAVRRGAEELWVVWCIGNTPTYRSGLFPQYVHMIELSANGALFEEFDRIREINSRIEAGESAYGQTRRIRLHLIRPEYPLPLDPEFYLGEIDAATLIAMGYEDAKRYLKNKTEDGLPFEPEITKMKDGTLGIAFRETMTGGFSLGQTDPAEGQRQGKDAGTSLALHAAVEIPDVKRFREEPAHAGRLTGHIDFRPFGGQIPGKNGVFNLFSPSDQPKLKLMVYELGFEHDGRDYYLAGRKEVRDDPGFDLWEDTTTLYTRLHEGRDQSDPVVGAGILTLGPADLLKLVSTMRVTNAKDLKEKVETLGDFTRFFLGELADSYVKVAAAENAPGSVPGTKRPAQ